MPGDTRTDFSNSQFPSLLPLAFSHAAEGIEEELRDLFGQIFYQMLAPGVFDVNVLGAAHLGTFELVRKAMNVDGLTLLKVSTNEEPASRYLYRAWKSRSNQGRGLVFLKTFLQILFPGSFVVEPLWQRKIPKNIIPSAYQWICRVDDENLALDGSWSLGDSYQSDDSELLAYEYGDEGLFALSETWYYTHRLSDANLKVNGFWKLGEKLQGNSTQDLENIAFMTSRVRVTFNPQATAIVDKNVLMQIVSSIVPARIVPVLKFSDGVEL